MITLELDEDETRMVVAALRWVRHNRFDQLADAIRTELETNEDH